MNKSGFIFAPLFVIAAGTLATFAHAGTITVSNFSTPERTAVILGAAEKQVLTDKTGTISAVCGNRKMGIPPFFNFEQDNNFLLTSCAKGLVVKVTNVGYKSSQYNNAFKMRMLPAGAREPSTATVSDFSAPYRVTAVVNALKKVVFADGRVGTITASGDGENMHVTNAYAVPADQSVTSVYKGNRMNGVKTSN
ncbi:hypothetical protein [Acidithiobacillus sp. HP-11]|uniref:hypothetical protein n=1 Tax=Acidithiobacillus sp. HP-11 TaxID=2697656 RepID=UPI00187908BE|nr:hypothetical protein [Acidithiobacillus sp. HP-11]MBE7566825.1 hypothetical protein [Acidithiobacillus sp. HP-11]